MGTCLGGLGSRQEPQKRHPRCSQAAARGGGVALLADSRSPTSDGLPLARSGRVRAGGGRDLSRKWGDLGGEAMLGSHHPSVAEPRLEPGERNGGRVSSERA